LDFLEGIILAKEKTSSNIEEEVKDFIE